MSTEGNSVKSALSEYGILTRRRKKEKTAKESKNAKEPKEKDEKASTASEKDEEEVEGRILTRRREKQQKTAKESKSSKEPKEKDEKASTASEKDEEKNEFEDEEDDEAVAVLLLDQPLETSGKRERKNVQRFAFEKDSEEYKKKVDFLKKTAVTELKTTCKVLQLEKSGTKNDLVERIMAFHVEPKNSVVDTGRSKRAAEGRANNRAPEASAGAAATATATSSGEFMSFTSTEDKKSRSRVEVEKSVELGQDVYRLQKEVEQKSEEIVTNSVMYRQKLQELERDLQESRETRVQAELEKNSAVKKIETLQKMVDELTAFKKCYEETMVGKDKENKEMQDKINRLEVENTKIDTKSLAYIQESIDAQEQMIAAQKKVIDLKEKMATLQAELDVFKCHQTELEQEIGKVTLKEQEYGEQVTALQTQKTNLELKVSELESCKVELHNRLIMAQTSSFSLGRNATLPPNVAQSSKHFYRRQLSEENADEVIALQRNVAEAERAEANSSPDLAIDSDYGRFFSLETNTNNVLTPSLQSMELTKSMNMPADEHCCQKSIELAQKNNKLKRELKLTKQALKQMADATRSLKQREKQLDKNMSEQLQLIQQLQKEKNDLASESAKS